LLRHLPAPIWPSRRLSSSSTRVIRWPLPTRVSWLTCCKRMCSSVSDVLDVCCKCFIWMLQKYIGMLHMLQSVPEACSKHLFKMFHLFQSILQEF
jgi:hypothetical protein